ncbi:MAG: hypothetical protein MJB14_12990 [Spirochaetes bacterium]|nr:hypothetical protein [Spirochaetota bacterium]
MIKKIVVTLSVIHFSLSLFSGEIKLDQNKDGKTDRWITVNRAKQWLLYDINKNSKPDESIFYVNEKEWIYLIANEKLDFSGDGKPDVWIKNKFSGKTFVKTISIDSNYDGQIDLIRMEKNEKVYEQKSDTDFDRLFDTFEFFNHNGEKTKEGIDTNKDQNPDDFYYFEGKHLVKQELDTNYDKKPDLWILFQYFSDGKFEKSIIFKDNNTDGKADEWHYTNQKRQVIRIERDTNFDGKVDKIEDLLK